MIVSYQRLVNYFEWETDNDNLIPKDINTTLLEETISFYQVADYLYRNNGLKLKK